MMHNANGQANAGQQLHDPGRYPMDYSSMQPAGHHLQPPTHLTDPHLAAHYGLPHPSATPHHHAHPSLGGPPHGVKRSPEGAGLDMMSQGGGEAGSSDDEGSMNDVKPNIGPEGGGHGSARGSGRGANKGDGPPAGKKTKGRVKIKMEFIDNKLRRYTTFSKRKTGIMKKVNTKSKEHFYGFFALGTLMFASILLSCFKNFKNLASILKVRLSLLMSLPEMLQQGKLAL